MSSRQRSSLGLLCKHHRVIQIVPEPGFASACTIGHQASPRCYGQSICECKGYEAEYAMAVAASTPEATVQTEPVICAEKAADSPQSDTGQSQESRTGLSHILDRVSAWIVRALPKLHIEDGRLKV